MRMTSGQVAELVEHPGMPLRQPATAILTVDTADRNKYDGNGYVIQPSAINNLYINTQQTLVQGYFTRIALTELNIPWNIPNVNERNSTLTLLLDNGDGETKEFTVDLAEGFYNGEELAAALNTAFAAEIATDPAYAAVNEINFEYTQEGCTFAITQNAAENTPFVIVPNNLGAKDDLCNMMGFGAIPNTFPSAPAWYGGYASLQYTPYIDIISQQFTKKQNVNDASTSVSTGRNLLHRLYLTPDGYTQVPTVFKQDVATDEFEMPGTKPFIIHKEFTVPKQIYWDTKEFISVLDLSLRDYKGNILYEVPTKTVSGGGGNVIFNQLGTTNTNWQMTFQITET